MEYKNVIIWGHPLYSHTQSYIHNAFFRAFKELGFNTYWFDNTEENAKKANDIGAAIYSTEGQVDSFIPLRSDCAYVTHNCEPAKYIGMRRLGIQVATMSNSILPSLKVMSPLTYYDEQGHLLYFVWATDLLPREFDFDSVLAAPKEDVAYWIGTIAISGPFENISEINPFKDDCDSKGIKFEQVTKVSIKENKELINKSYIAPTIVGKWQKEVGFMPCRIFKNMSYGELGVTNSYDVKKEFGDLVVYESDTSKMIETVGDERFNEERIKEGMRYVQQNHTYINRVKNILKVL